MTTTVSKPLQAALKEWAIAVEALAQGDTIVILRKGGIREPSGRFTVPHRQVWLYPTYEHQKFHLLKLPYAKAIAAASTNIQPTAVELKAWAHITHHFTLTQADALAALLPHHIWNQQLATERFRWKPKQPLSVLLLRVYRLNQPLTIACEKRYSGCRSWIELAKPLDTARSQPALSDRAYQSHVSAIEAILKTCHLPQSLK